MGLVCAECQCAPEECVKDITNPTQCKNCTKSICCRIDFHQNLPIDTSHSDNRFVSYSKSSIIAFLRYAKGTVLLNRLYAVAVLS
jgi:hypothetical protein